ncbi:uncharacterized protein LOC113393713 [Vanessa tameamea]|uniref:Uncharacterized protein LOC113393713 n=1 Tax=Vanessa tameamea TaxID=334116 RepID=A0A8B8HNU9_VANTA|nr:uncharacterized protein LOC113393713 [Vanessa tameamea]
MDHKSSENYPQCSTNAGTQGLQVDKEIDVASVSSKEIISQRLDVGTANTDSNNYNNDLIFNSSKTSNPFVLFTKSMTNQPLRISSNLPSPISLNNPETIQPLTLFLQALAKLNESSISLAIQNNILPKSNSDHTSANKVIDMNSIELTPPDSLTNAPPSYSFVLRQMAARRRRRLMGTFIPSPSFVQHTPPPNYATAFDIYVDSPLPPPPSRNYNFGFTPIPIVCPECGYAGFSIVASKITLCTHLCAIVLCLLCCWICAPLPYVLRSCKDVYHYCRNCRYYLGMYCPTNTESSYA